MHISLVLRTSSNFALAPEKTRTPLATEAGISPCYMIIVVVPNVGKKRGIPFALIAGT
jgi:hypothetical protein